MPEEGIGPVAAFDFDGTISRRDTLIPFLIRLRGRRRFARATGAAIVRQRNLGRDEAKAALLRHLVAGLPADDYQARAQAYGESLPARLRPDTVARVREHRDRGHRVVVVSASLRDFLAPVVAGLGVDGLVATTLEVGPDGLLTGELAGRNVRGEEKPKRLHEHLGGTPSELWAYGNSSGDRALLAAADHPVRVTRRRLDPFRP